MKNLISRRDFLKVTGTVGAAGLLAACGGSGSSSTASSAASAASSAASSVAGLSADPVDLTISWWGGDSRHEAYQNAIKAFEAKYSNISVAPTFSAWTGWVDAMSTKFTSGTAEDVCQINWNWLYNYSAKGQTFIDLNTVSDYLDLTQWDEGPMNSCYVADSQQAVPVAMTGRIFFWNMTTFDKAGIGYPTTEEELLAAGKTFKEKLGDDYYPLHLGGYDRVILMVFYLESKYGKEWADPATSTLNYTRDEIIEGIDFIKSLLDNHVIINLKDYNGQNGSGTTPTQSQGWISGKIAGIMTWDSSGATCEGTLDDENRAGFTVGDEIKFGDYNGGYSKVSMGMAITQTCKHPAEAATLINYLLNDEEGAGIMGSACGIPASKSGLAAAKAAGAITDIAAEANQKVMDFVAFQMDPLFESSKLTDDATGYYTELFNAVDYDGATGEECVDILLDGIEEVGYTIA